MPEHKLHAPHRSIAVPIMSDATCPFCSNPEYRPGKPCGKCGMIEPSRKTTLSASQLIASSKKKTRKKSKPVIYAHMTDGVNGLADLPEVGELEEYATALDRLSVPVGDMPDHDDSLLPTQRELDDLPWL